PDHTNYFVQSQQCRPEHRGSRLRTPSSERPIIKEGCWECCTCSAVFCHFFHLFFGRSLYAFQAGQWTKRHTAFHMRPSPVSNTSSCFSKTMVTLGWLVRAGGYAHCVRVFLLLASTALTG
ncbi:unnamed protein product, partial [Ectocarpus sp. 12 AP-2014]